MPHPDRQIDRALALSACLSCAYLTGFVSRIQLFIPLDLLYLTVGLLYLLSAILLYLHPSLRWFFFAFAFAFACLQPLPTLIAYGSLYARLSTTYLLYNAISTLIPTLFSLSLAFFVHHKNPRKYAPLLLLALLLHLLGQYPRVLTNLTSPTSHLITLLSLLSTPALVLLLLNAARSADHQYAPTY